MQFDRDHLAALAAVLRRGSFEAAALDLSVTPSAVSQRIKALEDRVGASLIRRGTPCTATAIGARLARHAGDIALLEGHLARDLALEDGPEPAVIRIAVNADSLATWLIPALAEVPQVLFDLVIDDQDHSADWLRRGEVAAAVTSLAKPVAGCDAIPLGALRYLATASPGFVAHWFPRGTTPGALSRAPCLIFNAKDMLQRDWIERAAGRRLAPPAHYLPSSHAFIDAACAGLGWGMNHEVLVRPLLDEGRLLALPPAEPLDVPLVWQVSRIMAPALRPLTQSIRRAAARMLR